MSGRSELERRLEERATVIDTSFPSQWTVTGSLLREAAAALGEMRLVATDAVYSLKLYRTALCECEAWIDLGLIERLDAALARLSPGDPAKGGGR